jgi:hypothetical protein
MELIGLLLAVPVTFVTSLVFCLLAYFGFRRWPRVRHVCIVAAFWIVGYLAAEVIAVFTIGPFHLHAFLGPIYWTLHMVGFLFGPPAVAVLVFVGVSRLVRVAAVPVALATLVCWFVCMTTLLGNIAIDEDIHGIDGSGHRPTHSIFPL